MRYHFICESVFVLTILCAAASAKKVCRSNGEKYALGKDVPSTDPCQICTCRLGETRKPEVVCHPIACDMLCDARVVEDGTCCGHCVTDTVPVHDLSQCDPSQCPKLRCSKRYQFKSDDMCCPQCKCRRKGKQSMPGLVGDTCDGCICNGTIGRIICEPVTCPDRTIECVDPVKGDDCCYYCPNGKTCAPSNNMQSIIKYGEYKRVKKNICACAGEPWYPYAFCAGSKVNPKAFKGMAEFIAPIMDV